MPRKYDADLCRAKGWEAGAILRAESDTGTCNWYVLTAIGQRAILVSMVQTSRGPLADPNEDLSIDPHEFKMSGQLYQRALSRIGTWDFATNSYNLTPGTDEYDSHQKWLLRRRQPQE